jgi:hypothetical protein
MAEDVVSGELKTSQDVPAANATELERIGSQTSYDAFLSAAKALEPGVIEECCADVVLAYHNVTRGVENVLGSGLVIVGKLPDVNISELSMLPRLAQGLAFAALQVQRELRNAPFGMLFERAQNLRRKLRKAAEALAEANLLPGEDTDEVRLQGQREVLEDCLALTALFKRNEAALTGRSPVSAPDLREVEQVVQKLRVMLGQQTETSDGGPFLVKAIDMRDRFWTLLNQRHEVLWRCGAWLYGRAVEERVPPLPVRQAVIRKPWSAPFERGVPQAVPEARRSVAPPPAFVPAHAPLASTRGYGPMSDLERKTKFLVRFGVIPPQR